MIPLQVAHKVVSVDMLGMQPLLFGCHNKVPTHMVLVLIVLIMMLTDTPVVLEDLVTSLLLLSTVVISGIQTFAACLLRAAKSYHMYHSQLTISMIQQAYDVCMILEWR